MRLDDTLAQLPYLGQPLEIRELPGGLTNHNYRVRTVTHDVVVRLSSTETDLLSVDREHEWLNSRAAATAGVGAPVIDYLPGKGVLVVAFLPGITYTADDVAANLPRVAAALRRLHGGPEFASRFDMFEVQRSYAEVVDARQMPLPDGYEDLASTVARVEQALRLRPEPLVPCHNDLLPANILDDGGDLRIIDYEYSGMNEASFELGNLACESHLDREALSQLVASYHGQATEPSQALVARAELWGLVGRYAWTLWGVIQHAVSDVDHDFWSFAMERFEPAAALLTSSRLGSLLSAVTADPS
ncbi:MAG: choline kinase family protein [Humibacillus sp.]|nr:choline kinase family protein [Humibacillus sp.]MDN5777062.1 choline kinase family protein [Humibacillus sp.]